MLIPQNFRIPARQFSLAGPRTLRAMVAANPTARTLGLAAAQPGPSVIEAGGVRASAGAFASCAVAVTKLESRGGRIFGVPCSGTGPVAVPPPPVSQSHYAQTEIVDNLSSPQGMYGVKTFTNPGTGPASVTVSVTVSEVFDFADASGSGFRHDGQPTGFSPGVQIQSGTYYLTVAGGGSFTVRAFNRDQRVSDGTTFFGADFISVSAVFSSTGEPVPDWTTAPPQLAWITGGLPWWGATDAAARAGVWVRRAAWADPLRQIRFEAGAGTTRAVAVQAVTGQVGAAPRVATDDFGAAEFLAEDWMILSTVDPAPIDCTDFVFDGPPGSVPFFVLGEGGTGAVDPQPVEPPPAVSPLPDGDLGQMLYHNGAGWVPLANPGAGGFVLVHEGENPYWKALVAC